MVILHSDDYLLKRINEVLDAERPDLVVFTGDVVYAKPAETAMRTVLACASSRKIPFVVTFGNHDNEQDKTRAELYDIVRVLFLIIFSRTEVRADSPDYVLALQASDSNRDAAHLYCMDSCSPTPAARCEKDMPGLP